MKTRSLLIASLLLSYALHAHGQTNAPGRSVIKRAGEPDCVQVTDDNKAMAHAMQKARNTTKKFIAALRSPKNNQSCFAIKKPFIEGDKVEHIWINEVTFDGKVFHGKVDNEPVDIKAVRLGDAVTLKPEEISDWMYVQDGKLVGGYTICAACRDLSPAERKQFEQDAGCRIK